MFRKLFFWALVPGGVNNEVVARVGWLLRGRAGSVPGAEPGAGRARPGVCRSGGDGLREGRSGLYNLQLARVSHVTAIHCPQSPLPHVKWPDGVCGNSMFLDKPRWKSSLSVRAGRDAGCPGECSPKRVLVRVAG